MVNKAETGVQSGNGMSRYVISSYTRMSYDANETHSILVIFVIRTSDSIQVYSKPFILKGNIGIPEGR